MHFRKVLSDVLESDQNSLNFVRLVLAVSVLVSHSCSMLTGLKSSEPLANFTDFSLGQHAVNAFFVISGLTLSQSLTRKPHLTEFAKARVLRIAPALFVYGAIFAFVAGPFLTSAHFIDYFTDRRTWLYPAMVMVEFAKAGPPPGIFSEAVFKEAVNNPIWTIKYEIIAYIGLAILFRLGFLHKTSILLLSVAFAFAMVVVLGPAPDMGAASFNHLARYGFCFLLGVLAYHFRHRLSVSPWLLTFSIAFAVISSGTRFQGAAYMVLAAQLVLVAGAGDYPPLTLFCRKTDLSYGIYIYGWPIQQSLATLIPGIGTASLLVLSLTIVPFFAVASWIWVEKPALRLKGFKPTWPLWRLRQAS